MTRWPMIEIVAALLAGAAGPLQAADDIRNNPWQGLEDFTHGTFHIQLRPRYNRIEEDDKPEVTRGGTYRVLAGWRSQPIAGMRFLIEGVNTGFIGRKEFNDDATQINGSEYPLLPDPRHTGVNQANVDWRGSDVRVLAGRQVVRLDNQRWVSDNDFRQIPQVFDGVRAWYTGLASTEIEAGHFRRVRTTSGELETLRLTTARAAWNVLPAQTLTAYAVFHDQAQNGAFTGFADNSYRVAGLRFEGSLPLAAGWDASAIAEAAQQRPFADGDSRVRGNYWRVGAGASSARMTIRGDYEVKGSNAGLYAVQMPLTDFYAWNGWTLHFFNTPRQGLRDGWATVRALLARDWTLYAEVHKFRSDFGSLDLGRELDVGLTYEITPATVLRLQNARYDAAMPGGDIRKLWLTLTWTP